MSEQRLPISEEPEEWVEAKFEVTELVEGVPAVDPADEDEGTDV